jgi:hypothetical protein
MARIAFDSFSIASGLALFGRMDTTLLAVRCEFVKCMHGNGHGIYDEPSNALPLSVLHN